MSDDEWIPAPGYDVAGFESAAGYSTIGQYRPNRRGRCKANKDTCKGFRTKDSEFCAGHLNAIKSAAKEVTSEHTAGGS